MEFNCVGYYSEALGGGVAFREKYTDLVSLDQAVQSYKARIEFNELSEVRVHNSKGDYTITAEVLKWDPSKGPWSKPFGA